MNCILWLNNRSLLYLTLRHWAVLHVTLPAITGISLSLSDLGWCHQEWMWSRYHTGFSVPCQMQLRHPWHRLNLLKFNGSCISGLNHLAFRRVFPCKNDFGGDEMDKLTDAKHALGICSFTFMSWHWNNGLFYSNICLWSFSSVSLCSFW